MLIVIVCILYVSVLLYSVQCVIIQASVSQPRTCASVETIRAQPHVSLCVNNMCVVIYIVLVFIHILLLYFRRPLFELKHSLVWMVPSLAQGCSVLQTSM